MSREIKFRVWNNQEMIYANQNVVFQNAVFWQAKLAEEKKIDKDLVTNYYIMQFTGLYDKNRNEIYEGDILKVVYDYCGLCDNETVIDEVIFTDAGSFSLKKEDSRIDVTYCEILGNIYENPELLKSGGKK